MPSTLRQILLVPLAISIAATRDSSYIDAQGIAYVIMANFMLKQLPN
jgi:hypothetical protein